MRKVISVLIAVCIFISVKSISTMTPKTTILGTHNSWTAYAFQHADGKVCYMTAEPAKSSGKYTHRDHSFLTIAHRPQDKTYDVLSVDPGYDYKKGFKPTLRIDSDKAVLLEPLQDMAWLETTEMDQKLVQNMIKSSNVTIYGESQRGTKITDTFSLKGFSKAYEAINKACGR